LRGRLASRPVDEVLREAESLVRAGVKELLVISQDTSAYGADLRYRGGPWRGRDVRAHVTDLAAALGELGAWVRLHYVYPYPHVDELIPLMAEGKLLPYLDIPFQHASPSVLRAMKRPAADARTLERIRAWRRDVPELTLRSSFIVGFPGETEQDFEYLLDWLEQAELDRVGCFRYEPVAGAASNGLPGALPGEVIEERWHRLMAAQQKISAARLERLVGRTIDVIVDEADEQGVIARSKGDAPEIDGNVYLPPGTAFAPGAIVTVRIDDADDYDLWARPVAEQPVTEEVMTAQAAAGDAEAEGEAPAETMTGRSADEAPAVTS
ncbi:MAG: radical SAM protein, partial [Gammaproteobacteria bacterium]|nr:radical SAM protein [Gammaproteobacteria bacterium]